MSPVPEKPVFCYNCFQEKSEAEGPCPHCGFDLEENEKKFPVALRAGTVLNDWNGGMFMNFRFNFFFVGGKCHCCF